MWVVPTARRVHFKVRRGVLAFMRSNVHACKRSCVDRGAHAHACKQLMLMHVPAAQAHACKQLMLMRVHVWCSCPCVYTLMLMRGQAVTRLNVFI